MKLDKNKILIQIGTHNGNDEFNLLVKESLPSKVILVEPNKKFNKSIIDNYKNIDNVFIENVAITKDRVDSVTLYWTKMFDDNGVEDSGAGFTLLPMDDWGTDMYSFEADSMTFSQLCEKYSIDDIHYLQIDTEGYDVEIIKSIDFSKVSIDIIKYEKWGFPEYCFTRYGENKTLYGVNAMAYASGYLTSLGYELIEEPYDIIAIKK